MARLTVRRLGYALGAAVTGLDLKQPLDKETFAELRAAWIANIVLCFPGQGLGPKELSAFSSQFGELDDNRSVAGTRNPENPEVKVIVNKPMTIKGTEIPGVVADNWHTDRSYLDRPTTATFLQAVTLPDAGGDTMFANTYMAYETLSPTYRKILDGLEAVHDVGLDARYGVLQDAKTKNSERGISVHQVVKLHPESGKKCLYLGDRVRQFLGMTEEESRPMVDYLNAHATRYEFVYRHRWSPGDLVMWDNRCALHYAVKDYDQRQLREMLRCSLLGEKSGRPYVPDGAGEAAVARVAAVAMN